MKKLKMAKMKDKKVRGEWAEMKFMTCAAEHGLCVSKPWGDSNSYDFVVGRPGHFVAVQVKCTVFNTANGVGYVFEERFHGHMISSTCFSLVQAHLRVNGPLLPALGYASLWLTSLSSPAISV